MKLLYLYIRDYGILKDIEFNFDSNYRYHFDKVTRELTQLPPENPLPDDFFSINKKGNDRVVESISALIGNNGSGKTFVARYIDELETISGIIITLENNHRKPAVYCFNARSSEEANQENEFEMQSKLGPINIKFKYDIVEYGVKKFVDNMYFMYCSNSFNTQNIFKYASQIYFKDMSTSGMIRNALFKDRDRKQCVDAYCAQETLENVRFFAAYQMREKKIFAIPVPTGCYVGINDARIEKFISLLKEREPEHKAISDMKSQIKKDLFDECSKKHIGIGASATQGLSLIFFALLVDILYFEHKYEDDKGKRKMWELVFKLGKNLSKHIRDIDKTKEFKVFYTKLKNSLKEISEKVDHGVKMVEYIERYNWSINISFVFELEFSDRQNMEDLTNFISEYYAGNEISRYLDFGWNKSLSTGELSQLSIYSRFYSQLTYPLISSDNCIIGDNKPIIVFFDEIEAAIHPELQRELVSNVIKFFEEFYAGRKVHIIFASHSPVLLSDIPKSNVCFLERIDTKNRPEVKVVTPEIDNTFGANIHSLYRHSFFMKNGTMGAFATRKIKAIIDEVRSYSPSQLIEQRKYINERLQLIGEPVIRRRMQAYIDERISELSNVEERKAYYQSMLNEINRGHANE